MKYEATIGLEIHAELKTKTKMFCDSLNDPDEKHPNVNVCPVCMGFPGTLPVINEEAVKKVILTGLALNCQIARQTNFDRKNYFYPDLPKGYQISQYERPFCAKGFLEVKGRKIGITRIHLEEDAGRLQHDAKGDHSLVDFNRAGVPLMEMVTEPDLKSGEEVKEFAEKFRMILRYLGVSDADMEKGQMRVEVNISLRPRTNADDTRINAEGQLSSVSSQRKSAVLGTKVEVKNLNSIKAAVGSVDYEVKRQSQLLEAGREVKQETRGWDEAKQATFSQRLKESAHDYRYFPEPDLPVLNLSEEYIDSIKMSMPELPEQRRDRFKKQYGLNDSQVEIFTIARHLGDYYERVASELDSEAASLHREQDEKKEAHLPAKLHTLTANYLITELPALMNPVRSRARASRSEGPYGRATSNGMNAKGLEVDDIAGLKIEPEAFAELMVMVFHEKLSSTGAKAVLKEMAETGLHPEAIVKEKNLLQVSDSGELEKAVQEVIVENPAPVTDYKKGKKEALQFLVGKVMAKTKGKANPQKVNEIITSELEK